MDDVAIQGGTGEFTIVKFLYTVEKDDCTLIITAERFGRVRIVKVTKNFFGKISHLASSLYESAFKSVTSIVV